MKPILEIKNISKKFHISHEQQPYLSLRDSITNLIKSPFSNRGSGRIGSEDFWALKDISFNVYPGDSIGIIGKNGAGKSTLLKILSKITPPTRGKIIARGRIASLLEVGTGFHPELTGRENIFFNGSILGMKRREILLKFDEIVDFSGVEKFLDTPLKHYSSGMQLRLAFAVAAFLEPEILVIDEVLAVGDAEFQRKCLGKMENVTKKEGRTVLFVSHNLSQVSSICQKGILLDKGKKAAEDSIAKTVTFYLSSGKTESRIDLRHFPRIGIKSNDFTLTSLIINNGKSIFAGEEMKLEIQFKTDVPIAELLLGFSITDAQNSPLIECRSSSSFEKLSIGRSGQYSMRVSFNPKLKEGVYNINLGARSSKGFLEFIPSVAKLEILPVADSWEEWNKPSNGVSITPTRWEYTII